MRPATTQCRCCVYQTCNNPVQVLCLSDLQQPSAGVVSVRPATTQCRCCVCQTCNNPVQVLCLSDLQQPRAGVVSVRRNNPVQVLCLSDLQQPSAGVVSVRPLTIIRLILQRPSARCCVYQTCNNPVQVLCLSDQCRNCVYQTADHHQANPATIRCTGVVCEAVITTIRLILQ